MEYTAKEGISNAKSFSSTEKCDNRAGDFDPHAAAAGGGSAENEVVFFPDNDDRATARSVWRRE